MQQGRKNERQPATASQGREERKPVASSQEMFVVKPSGTSVTQNSLLRVEGGESICQDLGLLLLPCISGSHHLVPLGSHQGSRILDPVDGVSVSPEVRRASPSSVQWTENRTWTLLGEAVPESYPRGEVVG